MIQCRGSNVRAESIQMAEMEKRAINNSDNLLEKMPTEFDIEESFGLSRQHIKVHTEICEPLIFIIVSVNPNSVINIKIPNKDYMCS